MHEPGVMHVLQCFSRINENIADQTTQIHGLIHHGLFQVEPFQIFHDQEVLPLEDAVLDIMDDAGMIMDALKNLAAGYKALSGQTIMF